MITVEGSKDANRRNFFVSHFEECVVNTVKSGAIIFKNPGRIESSTDYRIHPYGFS